jgi:hypothetical protein
MPEELMVIAVTAILTAGVVVLSVAGMITRSIREKHRARSGAGPSLTQSELRHLLREAVEDGTQPLYAKIQDLEQKLERAQLPQNAEAPRQDSGRLLAREVEPASRA